MKKIARKKIIALSLACLIGIQPSIHCSSFTNFTDKLFNRIMDEAPNTIINIATFLITLYITVYIFKNTFQPPVSTSIVNMSPVTGITETLNDYVNIPESILMLVNQIEKPAKYISMNAPFPSGILLCGDSGVGKTHLVRAMSGTLKCPIFQYTSANLLQPYIGQSGNIVKAIFAAAREAAQKSKYKLAIIFIDEFDGIGKRVDASVPGKIDATNNIINTFLTEMDGFNKNKEYHVIVIGGTNNPSWIDKAICRSGRFDIKITSPPIDFDGRKKLIEKFKSQKPTNDCVVTDSLAQITDKMTPADIKCLFDNAGRYAVYNNRQTRHNIDFIRALPGDKTTYQLIESAKKLYANTPNFKNNLSEITSNTELINYCQKHENYENVKDI
ncbi:MAG TPA: ATP-binding protein [Candidatus Babeliales bacterium]|nr:ATP-binding protein [Candidatus Babeliales bacterium]